MTTIVGVTLKPGIRPYTLYFRECETILIFTEAKYAPLHNYWFFLYTNRKKDTIFFFYRNRFSKLKAHTKLRGLVSFGQIYA